MYFNDTNETNIDNNLDSNEKKKRRKIDLLKMFVGTPLFIVSSLLLIFGIILIIISNR